MEQYQVLEVFKVVLEVKLDKPFEACVMTQLEGRRGLCVHCR